MYLRYSLRFDDDQTKVALMVSITFNILEEEEVIHAQTLCRVNW